MEGLLSTGPTPSSLFFIFIILLLPSKVKADTINDLQYCGAKMAHDAFECVSFRAPLPSPFLQHEWPQGYDLRQSTTTQLIPSCPADWPGSDRISPALPCRCCRNIAGHCTAGRRQMEVTTSATTTTTTTTTTTSTTTTDTTTTAETQ